MDYFHIFQLINTFGLIMTGCVVAGVWSLNITNIRKMMPITFVISSPILGFSWYLVEILLDKKEMRKQKRIEKDERRQRKEEEKKRMEEEEKEKGRNRTD